MSKRKRIWRIKGIVHRDDLETILALFPHTCTRFEYGLIFRDRRVFQKYQTGKIKKLPRNFGETRYLIITNPDQEVMRQAYEEIRDYFIADHSYDFSSRVG